MEVGGDRKWLRFIKKAIQSLLRVERVKKLIKFGRYGSFYVGGELIEKN